MLQRQSSRNRDRRGQGVVEYGLAVSMIALLAAAAISGLGQNVSDLLYRVNVSDTASNDGEVLAPEGSGGGVGATGRKS